MVMSGTALSPQQVAGKIDAVTEQDVKGVQALVQKCKPTVVGYGNVGYVPHYDEICEFFKGAPAIAASTKPAAAPASKPAPKK